MIAIMMMVHRSSCHLPFTTIVWTYRMPEASAQVENQADSNGNSNLWGTRATSVSESVGRQNQP
eukprot:16345260-Heterocapsa_arctica.AAC.1